ncbi:hypothetical protein 2 [Kummerowia striata microvirus]|nr:hypothetical protein 2 [Kummerowia striata microvirus]
MGRRRRSRSDYTMQNAVTSYTASPAVRHYSYSLPKVVLQPVEDRRSFHPLGVTRPARLVSGHPAPPHVVRRSSKVIAHRSHLPELRPEIHFAVPKKTIICVRRKRRKEVLHALKKVGRRSGRGAKSRNWFSEIKC